LIMRKAMMLLTIAGRAWRLRPAVTFCSRYARGLRPERVSA